MKYDAKSSDVRKSERYNLSLSKRRSHTGTKVNESDGCESHARCKMKQQNNTTQNLPRKNRCGDVSQPVGWILGGSQPFLP